VWICSKPYSPIFVLSESSFSQANTLAYYGMATITAVKSVQALAALMGGASYGA
jgi:hypothetical protein